MPQKDYMNSTLFFIKIAQKQQKKMIVQKNVFVTHCWVTGIQIKLLMEEI